MTDIKKAVDQIEAILQPRGRCTECGGGEFYWKHATSDRSVGHHLFQPPKPQSIVEKIADVIHDEEMLELTGQDPLPWENCINARAHERLARRIAAIEPRT